MTDMLRYASCRLGCDETTPDCEPVTSTEFYACSSSHDLAFKCSSDSARVELEDLIDALKDDDYLDFNCGFDTSFDMQYLLDDKCLDLDTDGDTVYYRILASDCSTVVDSFDVNDDLFDFEHNSAFEAFLKAVATTAPSYDSTKYTDAKIGACNANSDPSVSIGMSKGLHHCKWSGNGIGGSFVFRFGVKGDRDAFCGAMKAICNAKWLQAASCYNFPDVRSNPGLPFEPPECDSTASLVTSTIRESCKAHKDAGFTYQDGYYIVDPPILDSGASHSSFIVYCDQTSSFGGQLGGWALYARGSDHVLREEKDVVFPCEYGVSTAAHWRALMLNMNHGMYFRDQNGKESFIQASKLKSGSCSSVQDHSSLLANTYPDLLYLWWDEIDCNGSDWHYSIVVIGGICGHCASLYNQGQQRFDVWPYDRSHAWPLQDELHYYVS